MLYMGHKKLYPRAGMLLPSLAIAALAGCQTTITPASTPTSQASTQTPVQPSKPDAPVDPQRAIVNVEDAAAARRAVVKNDQPLRAFAIMEKVVSKQKLMAMYASQFSAFLGRDALTRELANAGGRPSAPAKLTNVSDLTAVDAIQEIVAASKSYRVVILSEEHNSQQERVFAHLLAKALKTAGFTHLGAEAIWPKGIEDLKKNGPSSTSGFYTFDPVFADFLRQAKAMKYDLFAYEQREEQNVKGDDIANGLARERAQAENIKQILDANPNANIFIYAGGGHGRKIPDSGGKIFMGSHLVALMGTDVLSIRQNIPQSKPAFDASQYQAVAPALLNSKSTLFRYKDENKDRKWLTDPGYDMVVFHPRVPEILGRGSWMTLDGYRQLHVVKISPLPERTLLRARAIPLQTGGIAMDQVLILPLESEAALFLPVGQYELYRESESGETEKIGRATIK